MAGLDPAGAIHQTFFMKPFVVFGVVVLTVCLIGSLHAASRGGGGGSRGGGGGGRASAARAASGRSMPSNYGSMRTSHASTSSIRSTPRASNTSSPYREEQRTVATRYGGEATAGVSPGGDVRVSGETARGRTYDNVNPRIRGDGDGVIERLPPGARHITIHDHPYYYHSHHYYWPYYYGGAVYYQEVYPPAGTTLDEELPGAETIVTGGITYYLYDGIYYVKDGDHYVVSEAPGEIPVASVETENSMAMKILEAMCAHSATYSSYLVESTEAVERKGATPVNVKRRILISAPDHITATGRDGSVSMRFWYDGKTVSVLDEDKNVYATIEAPPTMEAMVDMLHEDYGLTIPLIDILMPNLCRLLVPVLNSIEYDGNEEVEGRNCHKLVIQADDFAAIVWVDADDEAPLPRKVDVTYEAEGHKPRYVGVINTWKAAENIDQSVFVFRPPPDARQIEMLKRPY